MYPFGGTSPTMTITGGGSVNTHQTYAVQPVYSNFHPYDSPRKGLYGYATESWLKQEIKKVDKERIKYPRRADLKLRSMELQRALKALKR